MTSRNEEHPQSSWERNKYLEEKVKEQDKLMLLMNAAIEALRKQNSNRWDHIYRLKGQVQKMQADQLDVAPAMAGLEELTVQKSEAEIKRLEGERQQATRELGRHKVLCGEGLKREYALETEVEGWKNRVGMEVRRTRAHLQSFETKMRELVNLWGIPVDPDFFDDIMTVIKDAAKQGKPEAPVAGFTITQPDSRPAVEQEPIESRLYYSFHGADKAYHVQLDGNEIYSTPDRRDAQLFIAQLKPLVAIKGSSEPDKCADCKEKHPDYWLECTLRPTP